MNSVIAAVAGRRIDAADAPKPAFPAGTVADVQRRIVDALRDKHVSTIVCAAACGADLTALAAAAELGIRRRIVLPYATDVFRRGSVADRPGNWGPLFDRLVAEAQQAGDLVILGVSALLEPYERTNAAILDEAQALGRAESQATEAFVVWDGPLTGRVDYTSDFVTAAEQRGIPVHAIGIIRKSG